ncbi:MAG: hypothetical protein JJT89_05225 [Nitriliruptoraceae bacterium]|nr:hypothetical protein [Nitriliruptoraceae bacterium]
MSAPAPDTWILARLRLRDDALGSGLLWVGFAVFVFALTIGVAQFRTIEVSGWEVGSQLPRWFVAGMGVYLATVYLPLYIAHGYTRRESARQLALSGAATIPLLAGLMTLGYAIERAIYTAAGWPQQLQQAHLFDQPTQYPLVYLEFLLLFTVWGVAGAFVGAAIYRHPGNGLFAIPIGLAMLGLAETALSPGAFEFLAGLVGPIGAPAGGSVVVSTAIALGCASVALPATWLVIRDLPMRNQEQ